MSLKMPKRGVAARFPPAAVSPRTISPVSRPSSVLALKTPPLAQEEEVSSDEDEFLELNNLNHSSKKKVGVGNELINEVGGKEGYLEKLSSFGRSHRRYFKLKGNKLYYAKHDKAQIWEEIDLRGCTVAESSSKLSLHCFQVITPSRTFVLGCDRRSEFEEWSHGITTAAANPDNQLEEGAEVPLGAHIWLAYSHTKPTYCNVCRDQLCVSFPRVTSRGLSCEICKYKVHKRCAAKAPNSCKWTTLLSMGEEWAKDALISPTFLPHQWLEGNLPYKSKCMICKKGCGSLIRLQDWRCMWCRATVHTACMPGRETKCPFDHVSTVPPTALHDMDGDAWSWTKADYETDWSPLIVFVNSKSGDQLGQKFLRRFKQLLNPGQIFDLAQGGPRGGLTLYRRFDPFRVLVCGGDGSVGWVMTEIDRLDIHPQCIVGVLPLGTGNDLARVLGWGTNCDDPSNLHHLVLQYEAARTRTLDRWSIFTKERDVPSTDKAIVHAPKGPFEGEEEGGINRDREHDIPDEDYPELFDVNAEDEEELGAGPADLGECESAVISQIHSILSSSELQIIVISTKLLCQTVEDIIDRMGGLLSDTELHEKCLKLGESLQALLDILKEETAAANAGAAAGSNGVSSPPPSSQFLSPASAAGPSHRHAQGFPFRKRDELTERANSLKNAVRRLVQHAEINFEAGTVSAFSLTPGSSPIPGSSSPGVRGRRMSLRVNGCTLPAPHPFFLCPGQDMSITMSGRKLSNASSNASSLLDGVELEDEEAEPIYAPIPAPAPAQGQAQGQVGQGDVVEPPTIEVDSPSSSSPVKNCKVCYDSGDDAECFGGFDSTDLSVSIGMDSSGAGLGSVSESPVPGPSSSSQLLEPFPRGVSPRASRRVSMGTVMKSPSRSGSVSSGSTEAKKPKLLPIIRKSCDPTSGMVSKLLLANVDTVCAVASPLMDPEPEKKEESLEGFREKCVMNNYFGIGIDAKITLDFHLKREEHPEKCSSRARNFVWYGLLGGKEFLQKSCKKLDTRLGLECDGKKIKLPRLQGIVILNIQSFMGGTNFWGGTKEDKTFLEPKFDDGIVEVVAVHDTVQMATSRLINLQHHRIAQCQSIKITIEGNKPVPVQVDGEAWLQAPGVVRILHKNRMQVLCRNRRHEKKLKDWEEEKKNGKKAPKPKKGKKGEGQKTSRAGSVISFFRGRLSNSNSPTPPKDVAQAAEPAPGPSPSPAASPSPTPNEVKVTKRKSIFQFRFLNRKGNKDKKSEAESDGISEGASSETKPVDAWTKEDVLDWLEHQQLGELKPNFMTREISGVEFVNLKRRDLLKLGIVKLTQVLQMLQTVEGLRLDMGLSPRDDVQADIKYLSEVRRGSQEECLIGKQTSL